MIKKVPKQKTPVRSVCSVPPRKVLIVQESVFDCIDGVPEIIQLRHPRTGQSSAFLISPDSSTLLEIQKISESIRSFFIGDSVSSDGDVYLAAAIDPIFIALPYLTKVNRCSPLDQVVVDEEFDGTERLTYGAALKDIDHVADQKGDPSLRAYIYNEDKTLTWLKIKVEKIVDELRRQKISTSSASSVSACFVQTEETLNSDESYLSYAHGLLSEYLEDEISDKLFKALDLSNVPEPTHKRKSVFSPGNEEKRVCVQSSPVATKPAKKTPSTKINALAKAAKGSKSISSFFSKK